MRFLNEYGLRRIYLRRLASPPSAAAFRSQLFFPVGPVLNELVA